MARPCKPRCIKGKISVSYFKPQGIPLRMLDEVVIHDDELEALRLYEVENLSQTDAAKQMKISQPTFARILGRANKKVASALVTGKAIKIEKKS